MTSLIEKWKEDAKVSTTLREVGVETLWFRAENIKQDLEKLFAEEIGKAREQGIHPQRVVLEYIRSKILGDEK